MDVYAWCIPKPVLMDDLPGLSGQHGGAGATETRWLTVRPPSLPEWLTPYGSSLDAATDALARIRDSTAAND